MRPPSPRRCAPAPRSTPRCGGCSPTRGFATGLGDEGGFAPEIDRPEDVLALLVDAIDDCRLHARAARVSLLALDPAASEFYRDGRYHVAGEALSSDEMITRYEEIAAFLSRL